MMRDDKTSPPAPRPVVAGHGAGLSVVQRTVRASGGCGETVTIVVRVERGWMLVSIEPSFLGRAFLDVEKADAVIRTLTLARDDLQKGRNGAGVRRS